jgi:subtilase family serine protease
MLRQRLGPLTAVALVVLAAACTAGDPTPAGAAGVGGGPSVSLRPAGGAPTLPAGASVIGPSDTTATVSAEVSLRPRDPAALDAFVTAVSAPRSPQYHHFLAPGRFASLFGPAPATIRATRAWLSATGLQVGATSSDGLLVPVSGPVATVQRALDVSLVETRLPGGRVARFTRDAPVVPATLAPSVQGVIGLSTVARSQPQLVSGATGDGSPGGPSGPAGATTGSAVAVPHDGPTSCQGAVDTGAYTADELASTYGLSALYGRGLVGTGKTIGLYELEPYTAGDIEKYQSCYGLTNTVTNVPVDGGAGSGSGQGEAALDIEDAMGLAPGASIKVFEGPNGDSVSDPTGPIDTYSAMVNDPSVDVISTSWGVCEPEMAMNDGEQATEATLFAEAATYGKTVVAASGDGGSSDCYSRGNGDFDPEVTVDDPADQPDVTGVGGTSLLVAGSPPTETVWTNGGGGVSADFLQPSWQAGPGVDAPLALSQCAALASPSCREVPDVSAFADPVPGVAYFYKGAWSSVGGTSVAAPLWAALIAVIDQGLGSPAGLVNPVLYAAGSCAASPFNDVTTGGNALLSASQGKYPATAGYDVASGWGSPQAARLLSDLASPPTCPLVTSVSPSKGTVAGGTTVTVQGSNFAGATSVRFGSVATSFSVTSPTSLVAQVPPGPPGGATVDVTVSNRQGSSPVVAGDRYTYALPGYWSVASDGGLFTFGGVGFHGSTGSLPLNRPVVGMAATPDDGGYWLVASDGGIFAFGDAGFYGSTGGMPLNRPVVGMAATPDGRGYWLVASDGGIFTFGDAGFYGSTGSLALNRPVVGMAATPDGRGYWLVASDGGIFTFGDANFDGSTGSLALNRPIVGMATTLGGRGYWLVASDGGIFAFGDAAFYGSTGGMPLNEPVVGMAAG